MLAGAAIAWACRMFAPLPPDAPTLTLPSQMHDFSAILANSKSTYTFVATNNLLDILFIDRVERSCGCTLATCDHSVVLPGQRYSVEATLSAPGFPEDMSSYITVHAHAGRRYVREQFHCLAAVEDALEFPESGGGFLRLGTWSANQLPAVTAITVNRGRYPLGFNELRAACPTPFVTTQVKCVSTGSWQVLFQMRASDTLGATGYPVTFSFVRNGITLPQTVVRQAYVELEGPICASPSSLIFTLAPGEHQQQQITISRRSTELCTRNVCVTNVETSGKNIAWNHGGPSNIVFLDYQAPTHAGPDQGEIILHVKDEQHEYKLRVGYLAMVS
jgi:hypothetical protein